MTQKDSDTVHARQLSPYMTPLGAWSMAIGTAIGWGSFVITSNTYLSGSGPLGSALGMVLGAAIMLVIGWNYHYMMQRHPDAGGIYTYTKLEFGYDRGFLLSWFLSLTYLCMFWANATSLPLFARYLIGDVFHYGHLYTMMGYDVWLGDVLLVIGAIIFVGVLCMKSRKITITINIALACTFTLCIVVCFLAAIFRSGGSHTMEPLFLPDKSELSQIARIAIISPWAFVGFENISHAVEEFRFPRKKSFSVLLVAVISTTALYILVILLSVTAYPPQYDSWLSYIRDLDNISGIQGLPAFYAAEHYLGMTGVTLLMLALLSLILTSLICNILALSRLFYALAKDEVLPFKFSKLNSNSIPERAVLLVIVPSLFIPFLGRTALGWIVDVTTVGATLVYGYLSAAALRAARKRGDKREQVTGKIGMGIMILFGVFLLLPNLFTEASMPKESYFIFVLWSVAGFFYFRFIMKRDHAKHFGRATFVWIILLSMIVFMSVLWLNQTEEEETTETVVSIISEISGQPEESVAESQVLQEVMHRLHMRHTNNAVVFLGLFGLALGAMLANDRYLHKQTEEVEQQLGTARSIVYRDALTGVKSKYAYEQAESQLNARIAKNIAEQFAIVVCDINGLKHVNDTLGHAAGDEFICNGCAAICQSFKRSPVFRVGGDEFVVLIERQDFHSRQALLDKFNRDMESRVGTDQPVVATGMADFDPVEDMDCQSVFERADQLMYQRKQELKEMGAITR